MKRANIPTKDALTLVKFEIIGFILSPNVFNFIVYEKMKKQYLSPQESPTSTNLRSVRQAIGDRLKETTEIARCR